MRIFFPALASGARSFVLELCFEQNNKMNLVVVAFVLCLVTAMTNSLRREEEGGEKKVSCCLRQSPSRQVPSEALKPH